MKPFIAQTTPAVIFLASLHLFLVPAMLDGGVLWDQTIAFRHSESYSL